jgi:ABC-type Mn2+/Zn2+ transport system ATPase subunit
VNTSPLVTLHDVSVGYGRHVVLSGLSLRLARGSYTALLGVNGSGKSTLLKSLIGLLPPLAGRIEFGSIQDRPPVIGYVPQRETLDENYPLSAFEVALMGVLGRVKPGRPVPRAEREWTRECLRATGAEATAAQAFAELSGGQKQRVLIARALATRPDFLVLDEPTAGIDAASSRVISELLDRLHREQGLTVLLVSHDVHTLRERVPEVIWLHRGRVLHGPAAALLTREKISEMLELELSAR